MNVLVTGGAGYIGSVIGAALLAQGHAVVVLDDLSRGHRAAVPGGAALVEGDVRDAAVVRTALRAHRCTAIVHLAALAEVAESVACPERYEEVNVGGTRSLAEAALSAAVDRIVFSSTAAVYGEPATTPIPEDATPAPTNPYGATKLAAERILSVAAAGSHGRLAVTSLRYFNACGADGARGEDHQPETHLIPLALRAARDGTPLAVFGDDYPTPDGTCLRDYVHVRDLAAAHTAALRRLPAAAGVCNLGTGQGDSVAEVLAAVERVTGRRVVRSVSARRPGDPAVLVASCERAARVLGWRPRFGLADAVRDAWEWLLRNPQGYCSSG